MSAQNFMPIHLLVGRIFHLKPHILTVGGVKGSPDDKRIFPLGTTSYVQNFMGIHPTVVEILSKPSCTDTDCQSSVTVYCEYS